MSAILTYHVSAGQLSAVAAGRVFHLPTHRDPSAMGTWEKVQELRSGKHTLWDHCFEFPHQHLPSLQTHGRGSTTETVIRRVNLGAISPDAIRLELFDWPGRYAQRFDGVDKGPAVHNHPGSALYVGDRQTGVYIHGWPPCHLKPCVVVLQHWDDLVRAVASEPELSFSIVV
jgi:hypothetical protein